MNAAYVLTNVILPVFAIIALGAVASRRLGLDSTTLSRATLYLFSPALSFRALVTADLTAQDAVQIIAFVLVTMSTFACVSWLITRAFRFNSVDTNAFMLTILVFNTGNYGLPVNLFAYGTPGLERAVLYYAVSSVFTYTVGIYVAASGNASPKSAIRKIFQVPQIYTVLLALGLRLAGLNALPEAMMRPIGLLADASVPVLLVVLGIELTKSRLDRQLLNVGLATATRLVVAAGIAAVVATVLGLQGLTRQVCIVQASMPTAITSVVFAAQFNTNPQFVTSVVLASTLASLASLTILLSLIS